MTYISECTPLPDNCEIVISKQPTTSNDVSGSFLPFPLFGFITTPPTTFTPPTLTPFFPPVPPPFPPPGNPGWPGTPIVPTNPDPPTEVIPEPTSIIIFIVLFLVGYIHIYKRRRFFIL